MRGASLSTGLGSPLQLALEVISAEDKSDISAASVDEIQLVRWMLELVADGVECEEDAPAVRRPRRANREPALCVGEDCSETRSVGADAVDVALLEQTFRSEDDLAPVGDQRAHQLGSEEEVGRRRAFKSLSRTIQSDPPVSLSMLVCW